MQNDVVKCRIARINNELERRSELPLYKYNNLLASHSEIIHQKQVVFHRSMAGERWVFGGNRTGKTECGAVEAVLWATGLHPFRQIESATEGWIVSLSTQVQRDVAQRKVLHYLDKTHVVDFVMISGSKASPERGIIDYILVRNKFGTISKIGFKSCDQGREKFQGVGLDWVWFDEEPPEDIYEECLLRTLDRGGCIWGTMTPLKGRTWVYERIFQNSKLIAPNGKRTPSEVETEQSWHKRRSRAVGSEGSENEAEHNAACAQKINTQKNYNSPNEKGLSPTELSVSAPEQGEERTHVNSYQPMGLPRPVAWHKRRSRAVGSEGSENEAEKSVTEVMFMSWQDNPFLSEKEVKKMERSLSSSSLENRKYGRFAEGTGLVFPEFTEENIIEPFSVPNEWDKIISIDPGLVNPTAVIWLAIDSEANRYVIEDYATAEKPVEHHAKEILAISDRLGVKRNCDGSLNAIIDSAALQNNLGSPSSVAKQFADCGIAVDTHVKKDVLETITRLKNLFCDCNGTRRLFVFAHCTHLIKELRNYTWGDNQRPVKRNDHCIDALRYAVTYNPAPKSLPKSVSAVASMKQHLIRANRRETH